MMWDITHAQSFCNDTRDSIYTYAEELAFYALHAYSRP